MCQVIVVSRGNGIGNGCFQFSPLFKSFSQFSLSTI